MTSETRTILTACADGVGTLTLNRPEARNALDMTMRRELEEALTRLAGDAQVRVLIVRGAGEHFCAGGDVKLMRDNPMTAAEGQSRVETINRAILGWRGSGRPRSRWSTGPLRAPAAISPWPATSSSRPIGRASERCSPGSA